MALAFIMLPVMARTTEDILNLVPNELRESAPGDGRAALEGDARASSVARRAAAWSPAPSLAVVRVAGETAPLLFTALSSPYWLTGLFGPGGFFGGPVANLTKTIYDFAGLAVSATGRSWPGAARSSSSWPCSA